MGVARDYVPLPAILTDADWKVAFQFYGANYTDPLFMADTSTWSLVLAPTRQRQPAAAEVHTFTDPANFLLIDGYRLEVSFAAAELTGWTPGVYMVELRQIEPDVAVRGIYLGMVTVMRGLSDLAALGGGAPLPDGSGGGLRVVLLTGAVIALPDIPGIVPVIDIDALLDFSDPDNFSLGLMTGVI